MSYKSKINFKLIALILNTINIEQLENEFKVFKMQNDNRIKEEESIKKIAMKSKRIVKRKRLSDNKK